MKQSPQSSKEAITLEDIVEQFTAEIRAGKTPRVRQYVKQYPAHADELTDLLSSVAMIEGLKNYSPNSCVADQQFNDIEVPDFLGEYRIVGEVGRGGMGIVFEAVHETLGRRVAIKVMTVGTGRNSIHLDRFHREAVSAATLHHTNIASVFGAGEDKGLHFYVMEYIEGQSLSQIIKGGRIGLDETTNFKTKPKVPLHITGAGKTPTDISRSLDAERANNDLSQKSLVIGEETVSPRARYKWVADTGQQIADALAYAHEKNILHRDIKPSNLVVDYHATVWLTDFGLAKNITKDDLTKTGEIIGTPQYMAPESFSGNYDARSETYCLGLTLYEMATLNPAFENTSPGQIIKAVTTSSPPPPRKMDSSMPHDLATIIEKSISREPEDRYQTAAEMRDDLRAFIADRPIAARKMSLWDQAVRFSRRNPLAAAFAAFSMLVLGLLVTTMSIGFVVTNSALRRAESNVDIALEAFDQTFRQYITEGENESYGSDTYGFEQIGGIEKAITQEDAQFVEKMLGYYQQLAIDNKFSQDVQTKAATANRLVANVQRLIGQPEKALKSYQQALNDFEEQAKRPPHSTQTLLMAVSTRNEMASFLASIAEYEKGLQLLLESKEELENYPRFREPELKLKWVQTINQIASEQVKTIFEFDFQTPEAGGSAGNSDLKLSEPTIGDGQLPPGPLRKMTSQIKKWGQEAVEEIDRLKAADPENQRISVTRAETYSQLAIRQSRESDSDSNKTLKVAIDELRALKKISPSNPQYQYLLALTQAIASNDEARNKSLRSLRNSQTSTAALVQRFPKMLAYRQLYGAVSTELGGLEIQTGDLDEADLNLELAGKALMQLKSDMPRDWSAKLNGIKLVKHLETLAGQRAAHGDVNDAVEIGLRINKLVEGLGLRDSD